MSEVFQRINRIKEIYREMQEDLNELGYRIDNLITEYLSQLPEGLRKHIIQYPVHRLKDEQSVINNIFFRRSVQRNNDENALFNLRDKVGTRIVLLTEDDVQKVAEFLTSQTEFWDIRVGRELNKILEGGFDYRAIHLYITPKPGLVQRFADKSKKYLSRYECEVQIRTNLQHTLAEVQHSVTYKIPYALDGDLEKKLREAYEKIKVVDDFLRNLFRSREEYDLTVQQLFGDITNLYIQLRRDLREQAGEKLQRDKINESDHRLNALLFQIYDVGKISSNELFAVCEKHWKDVEFLVNSKTILAREPIIVLIAYLFFTRKHTLRRSWILPEDILEEVYHHLGEAFE